MLKNFNKINIQLMCLLRKKSLLFNLFNYYYCNKSDNTLKHIHFRDFNYNKIRFINNPLNYNWNFSNIFFLFKFYLKNSWCTYRRFFGFSLFKKTRTNSKSQKYMSNIFRKFISIFVYKKFFKKQKGKIREISIHMEFLNKLWFFQWNGEWINARKNFIIFRYNNRMRKIKSGVYYSKKNKALNFIPKPLKKNKKKVFIAQDNFNVGFYFKFTNAFFKKILAGNCVK